MQTPSAKAPERLAPEKPHDLRHLLPLSVDGPRHPAALEHLALAGEVRVFGQHRPARRLVVAERPLADPLRRAFGDGVALPARRAVDEVRTPEALEPAHVRRSVLAPVHGLHARLRPPFHEVRPLARRHPAEIDVLRREIAECPGVVVVRGTRRVDGLQAFRAPQRALPDVPLVRSGRGLVRRDMLRVHRVFLARHVHVHLVEDDRRMPPRRADGALRPLAEELLHVRGLPERVLVERRIGDARNHGVHHQHSGAVGGAVDLVVGRNPGDVHLVHVERIEVHLLDARAELRRARVCREARTRLVAEKRRPQVHRPSVQQHVLSGEAHFAETGLERRQFVDGTARSV